MTAGNASGINDGGAAIVLARADAAEKAGLKPRARILGYAHAGVRPEVMGTGPIPAVKILMERTGLSIADFDVIESNEAFAAQALAVNKALGLDPEKVNPNGGAIALGHPVGATGCILAVKALYELERTGSKTALVTMCIGGGQGIAIAHWSGCRNPGASAPTGCTQSGSSAFVVQTTGQSRVKLLGVRMRSHVCSRHVKLVYGRGLTPPVSQTRV